MDTIEKNKELVLKYFYSWQKGDFEALRASLQDDVEFDMNGNKITGADPFVEMCKNGIKWVKVDLLDSIFHHDKAALIYDGITEKGGNVRVAEVITIENDKIRSAIAAIVGEG
ncbi:nuclear transport factor 2 family protein [Fulvivirgaceae bacterium BMA10]|uniref:Nuclear transport factor 2 family protein n=1 Tax=Splendidivirga corallicola TaxID=3051826 RepID=A0ABT8KVP7_9BACT|nr:nuclear transport factor 2 family protein [Fulvivirgaceae bacterium BMA10]